MSEASLRTKLLAGGGLVCVSTSVGVLYKASQAATGGFKYSTASAVCIAEFAKLCMSVGFHISDASNGKSRPGLGRVSAAVAVAREQLSSSAVMHLSVLSLLYAINNQLSFFVYTLADPGTIFLFKSASTMIVALIQCVLAGKRFSANQWKAMMLQACGMIIVQYNPCQGRGLYSLLAYVCLFTSTVITSITAARNEFTVKNFSIGLNVQNAVLYAGGVIINMTFFILLPPVATDGDMAIGFFDGYDNVLAVGVVVANSFIGLAIVAVYKYADAVTKCFASDITAVLLIIISSFFFGLQMNLTMCCGIGVVTYAVHDYISATGAAGPAAAHAKVEASKAGTQKTSKVEATSIGAKTEEGSASERCGLMDTDNKEVKEG